MNQGSDTPHGNWNEQRETISAYVDDALAARERAAFERHLATCTACQRELEELRQVRALLRRLPSPALPRSFTLPAEPAGAPARSGTPLAATPARTPTPARTVIPWPQRAGKIAQRIGTLAAAVGIALLLASAVQGHGGFAGGTSTASNLAPRSAGNAATSRQTTATARASGAQFGNSQQTPGQIPNLQETQSAAGAGATPSPTATSAPPPQVSTREPRASTAPGEAPPGENPPLLPLTGAGLLVGGTVLAVGGRAAARRGSPRRRWR